MTVVVMDTSVLIPLDRGRLAHLLPAVGMDLRASCIAIRCELQQVLAGNPGLTLRSESLSKYEMRELQEIKRQHVKLSMPDISSFLVARRLRATLLTDDNKLIEMSQRRGVACQGLVWCLDELQANEIDFRTLAGGIARIQAKEPNNAREALLCRRERYEALGDAEARLERRADRGRADARGRHRFARPA